uniref:Uncharacterized protein n=1 Tax=Sinocyclocheilus rhinocerous TaxID=307959 RepID=A0A673ILH4_9TELE
DSYSGCPVMASSSGPLNEELQCSICLDVFTDPVTTPCGHNFCRTCLNKFWTNTQTCFCPSCKVTFSKRTDLMINTNRGTIMGGKVTMIQRALVREVDPGTQPLLGGTNQPTLLRTQSLLRGKNKPPVPLPRIRSLRGRNQPQLPRMQSLPRAQVNMTFRGPRNHIGTPEYNAESVAEHFKEKLNLGRSEVLCDICDERKQKAVKSCLMCQSSYCETHLEPHHRVPRKAGHRGETIMYSMWKIMYFFNLKPHKHIFITPNTPNNQDVPENPKRFDDYCVLAKQGFSSGRFYYEVQVKGKTGWSLGVARESINRMGDISPSPEDGLWSMVLINRRQYIACDNPAAAFSHRTTPEIVGVFVDYEEGLVSFYDVGSSSHIYSFTGQTFTDKLYPYFGPGLNDKGKNSNPLIISPRGVGPPTAPNIHYIAQSIGKTQ